MVSSESGNGFVTESVFSVNVSPVPAALGAGWFLMYASVVSSVISHSDWTFTVAFSSISSS